MIIEMFDPHFSPWYLQFLFKGAEYMACLLNSLTLFFVRKWEKKKVKVKKSSWIKKES